VLQLSPEDIVTVASGRIDSGPAITGSVQPERRADLRAEVSAVVLQVLKDNGDPVRRGELLVRLDDTAIRDGLNSALAAARASEQQNQQAERQYQRLKTLVASGMVSVQEVETAEIARNNALSNLESAKSLVAAARQQLQRTESRAPFDGVVSDRKVSAGDTAQVGKELLKVIDPRSMRFEGMIPAEQVGSVKAGQVVRFQVQGFAQNEFVGKITQVNPSANITTRQVEVLVAFADGVQQPKLGGLYAEGRVETSDSTQLSVPASVLVKVGEQWLVWRILNNKLQKLTLQVGERDARSGEYAINGGLKLGDQLIRYPTSALQDGQTFERSEPSAAIVATFP
jgi:RND family efflux transporter MFP subunit